MRAFVTLLCLLPLTACTATDEPQPANADRAAAEALVRAAPGERPDEVVNRVLDRGDAIEAELIAALERQPAAAGAQAAIAVLGRIGGAAAIRFCHRLVDERAPLAVEAALALAELPTSADDDVLARARDDRFADSALRTAAACALCRHGERDASPAFLAAIVRAGTPAAREDARRLGLPQKTRWARERYFVQRLLRQLDHQDLLRALDSDASWPVLEQLAPRVERRLRDGG